MFPGLPIGMTYSPSSLVELKLKKKELAFGLNRGKSINNLKNNGQKSKSRGDLVFKSKNDLRKSKNELYQSEEEEVLIEGTTFTIPADNSNRRFPSGFLSVSPFPGFDADKVDKTAIQNYISAIYKVKMSSKFRDKPSSEEIEYIQNGEVPRGCISERHPTIFPSKSQLEPFKYSDFYEFAPVIFDILEPGSEKLSRILTRVVGINKDLPHVSVDKRASRTSIGSIFSMFIKNRNEENWICVNLEVVDDDYLDDISVTHSRPQNLSLKVAPVEFRKPVVDSKSKRRMSVVIHEAPKKSRVDFSTPQPAGYLASGEPIFAPPVNLPPFPAGYTSDGEAYYGKSAVVKPIPAGVTCLGNRYYNLDGKVEVAKNVLAGYDNDGFPFFIRTFF